MSPVSAKAVLQNRALQCSFSSVFHIRKTATNAKSFREAKQVESIFLNAVGVPMACMAALGASVMMMKKDKL
jgi:hypothetical protein